MAREIAEIVELVCQLDPFPRLEAQVRDDALLPGGLFGMFGAGETKRQRYRSRQALRC